MVGRISFAFFLASPFSSAALPLAWPAAWFASPFSSCALPAASPRSSAAFPLTSPPVMLALASLTLSLAAAVPVVSYRTPHVVPTTSGVMYLLTANFNTVDELVRHCAIYLLETILGSIYGVLLQLDGGREGCSWHGGSEVGRACGSTGDGCHSADGHLSEERHFDWRFWFVVACGTARRKPLKTRSKSSR
ncbi:hypothetical protein FJTKL_07294 [Diaporthe vaccinii]|uniref:Uncharacterized protein n=1 Tax=Diaporthe vaccinii TaxID=105482 RepID=A0ABR4EUC8_9PEZI